MARIVYALSGQGRGHTSRGLAVADGLRQRGHTVSFCGGGTARAVLEGLGEPVLAAPTLRQVMRGNRLLLLTTGFRNAPVVFRSRRIILRLAEALREIGPDLVVSDFDAYAHRAAARIGVPVVSLDHQQIVTETLAEPPPGGRFSAFVASTAVRSIVARHPERRLISTFFRPPLRSGSQATLVGPILRPEIRALHASRGEHVLVYFNGAVSADHLARTLAPAPASFVVYGVTPKSPSTASNVHFRAPSHEQFLADLASSAAVICTAGYTLLSEALHLGKPILAVPNGGLYEQALNAVYLERQGRGRAVMRRLAAADVTRFLANADQLAGEPGGPDGLREALDAIENVLAS